MNSLLPPNHLPTEAALEATTARIAAVPVPVDQLWNPWSCPVAVLPWLAWALSVDHWDPTWSTQVKRQVIAASGEVHRRKGTVWAVVSALSAIDVPLAVREWFETGRPPFTFRVEVPPSRPMVEADYQQIITAVQTAKNLRSHLEIIRLLRPAAGTMRLGIGTVQRRRLTLLPPTAHITLTESGIHYATGLYQFRLWSINYEEVTS